MLYLYLSGKVKENDDAKYKIHRCVHQPCTKWQFVDKVRPLVNFKLPPFYIGLNKIPLVLLLLHQHLRTFNSLSLPPHRRLQFRANGQICFPDSLKPTYIAIVNVSGRNLVCLFILYFKIPVGDAIPYEYLHKIDSIHKGHIMQDHKDQELLSYCPSKIKKDKC